ncbi:dipeptidyl peptidase 9 isoform X1 [Neodiprion fabricii]|uniref:dipeptidyl peptidase 9 isoform X1 n=1 Tax=Neodiprion fabricii TaxID=2872261 RepID=UPI001ED8E821|nr:dipeptidyl peptidase 9 isoform X1 [Neodiprion fabricii]XP_046431751.1 dipeptidyl peptidase 9 isoform X1 [Neodiprion fabricii]XP_046431752.1 dipeptidyl peptidase 9 isoform X1 [Neodiprion fabricii]XP_046431753.1 dipeptidyl peptidase 9 isoform X1 [Neodiprion fabricii]XP_046431754.1 dipeptidyl peptidase 9 isoform X1 [Neodiprion fabricii]XP_046431757.1 dipeptidyl peptidase 9 isoform X1 [Neodiprion fabricii]XP_046431758.1 dipeptidyl peptidase 9 isoform X1 [Neodiprion fabricii]
MDNCGEGRDSYVSQNGTRKKTWSELRGVVSDLRRRLAGVSAGSVPASITFRSLPDGRMRIYFLSTPPHGWETTLLYVDIGHSDNANGYKLNWQSLIEANFQSLSSVSRLSREEQLLWERKRLATWGITSYEIHPESGKLVFPAASSLYQCVDNGSTPGLLFPSELRMSTTGAKLCPQICPWDHALVAHTCAGDLHLSHSITGSSVRLTYAKKGGRSLADDPLMAGTPSYVMQEEFTRFIGYWWQPKSTDGIYRIVYEEVDESDVKIFCFPSSTSNSGEIEEFRFPRAGTSNARSNLKMVQFKLSETVQVIDTEILELQYPLHIMFPWMEYVVRVGWTPDAQYVWVQLLDRRQQRLELVLLSVDNFCEPPPNVYNSENHFALSSASVQVIYSQTSNIWINVNDLLYFLPSDDPTEVKFIWGSEETGFRHLYLVTSSIAGLTSGVEEPLDRMDNVFLQPRVISKIALTKGNWEVLGRNLWVDETNSIAYFSGLREGPLEQHVYAVSLRRPLEIRLLTRPGYSYNSVYFNKQCTMLVAVYSSIKTLPTCQVFRISQSDWTVESITLTPVGYLLEPSAPDSELFAPEIYTHKIKSGETIFAMIFKPHNYQPGKKYPTILNVYGGPEVQLVSNTFKGMRHLRMHMLAAQGYSVVLIDSRGSQYRGLMFESYLQRRMGTVELIDQVEVLHWLADTTGCIDMSRVAIHGWSYGGYLSLMGLTQYPDIFKLAIAGAPVTSWNLYDTGYTERYMDLPENNPQGYATGSVLNYINKFPEEENRLLIIHGLIDENVHFFHTSQLINALVKAGKPYELQVYPNERHSLRNVDASKHYETTVLSFLQNHL